ncbi:DUF4175 family protein [Terriglobus albidus]|uniref:DUF4175 family protein n=1 Tax=Terriglobus albidus TaxID=1592106 RepID=UPI0021DF500A|nr:DUF4175 family protein [Terriglobus albidus]
MSRQQQLNAYIDSVERRLRLAATLRGSAVIAATALIVTVVAVLILNAYAFPLRSLTLARLAMLLAIIVAATIALVIPLLRLTRAASVKQAERAFPAFDDRLLTFSERHEKQSGPFLELLAGDTLAVAETASPHDLVPQRTFYVLMAGGVVSLGILLWMIAAGPGYLGYGASLLWTGPKKDVPPLYDIRVSPGNAALRRNTDQLVTAQITGVQTDKVRLFARYQSAGRWEPVPMKPLEGAPGYQFLFTALPENVEYYVTAGPLTSTHYTLRVVDMPQITAIKVTYNYPKWTGMKPQVDDHGGDLRAIEGTEAELEIHTDRPLHDGLLALDDGTTLKLSGGQPNTYTTTLKMQKDGAYHIAGIDQGQPVRLTEDYFVATNKAEPPTIAIEKPSNDYRASPIEEVTVKVKGSAEFGLNAMALHYSVNGGAEQTVPMLKAPGLRQADGSQMLSLESFKMQPGDVISLYATARDGHAESKTEISFIQADPFEREFSQSQAGGGGGGGGGGRQDQGEISRREKELIAQTWKQQNDKKATQKSGEDQAKFLSDVQSKLRQQVDALSSRLDSRDMTAMNESFNSFEKDMQEASKAMIPATDKLRQMQWKEAIANEQKALQYLLRAEATFRQIQVAFGQRGGGGGGGGSMGRDLATLLDLELDTAKNQYESAQTGSPQEEKEKKIDDALQKLDALARRQEELAQQQRNNPQQSFQERWQQEMLRREAEQLQKQMEQLTQNQNGQQGQQNGQQSGQQGSQSGSQSSSSQSGSQSGSRSASASGSSGSQPGNQRGDDPRVQQALDRLRRANDEMKRAASPQAGQPNSQQAANEAARRAAESLRQATGLMGGAQQQQASGKLDGLSQEADRIAKEERNQADRIRQFVDEQNRKGPATTMQEMVDRSNARNRIADDRQKLSEDFSRLQNNLRNTARQLAPTQPGVSGKLRDALNAADQDGLDNRVQRTADWLRRGINPESNGTEEGIRAGIDKLSQQVRQAANGIGSGNDARQQQRQNSGDQTAALSALDRFRSRIESLNRGNGQQPGNNQQRGQSGQPNGQNGSRNGQGQGQQQGQQAGNGQQPGGQQGGNQRGGGQQQMAGNGGGGGRAEAAGGGLNNGLSNDLGNTINRGGGYDNGTVWGNVNTGNNQFDRSRRAVDPGNPNNPADMQQIISQGIRDLNNLRQAAGNDPQAKKDIEELQRQMQNLDPRRFPGNPQMVEHMSAEVLAQADKLELRLRQNGALDQGQVRSPKPKSAAPAYQDAVADYYRRLSKTPQ